MPLIFYVRLQDMFCNASTVSPTCYDYDGSEKFCECLHQVRIPFGSVTEIVIISASGSSGSSHPIHLHGHSFRVVALDKVRFLHLRMVVI